MRKVLFPLWLALAAPSAQAADPQAFVPARAVALGDNRFAASGNDAIFLNPAALGAQLRYALQLDYAHTTGAATGDAVGVSLADSLSNPAFPAGLAYRYVTVGAKGAAAKGSIKDVAFAHPFGDALLVGVRVSRLTYTLAGHEVSQFTGDVGTLVRVGPVSAGVVGFNLLKADVADAPRGVATGLALSDDRSFLLAGDLKWEWPGDVARGSWSLAGEYLLAELVPVRAAYGWDGRRGTASWSLGSGLVTQVVGVDVSYRRDLVSRDGYWAVAVKVFGN